MNAQPVKLARLADIAAPFNVLEYRGHYIVRDPRGLDAEGNPTWLVCEDYENPIATACDAFTWIEHCMATIDAVMDEAEDPERCDDCGSRPGDGATLGCPGCDYGVEAPEVIAEAAEAADVADVADVAALTFGPVPEAPGTRLVCRNWLAWSCSACHSTAGDINANGGRCACSEG